MIVAVIATVIASGGSLTQSINQSILGDGCALQLKGMIREWESWKRPRTPKQVCVDGQ